MKLRQLVESSDLTFTGTCRHKHKLNGTGAVFYQSLGFLECGKCRKFQAIKKPLS
jgi:hypothetical protein